MDKILLQSIFDNIGLGIAIINGSNRIIWYNAKFENYFSIDPTHSENLHLTQIHSFLNDKSFSSLINKIKFSYSPNKVYVIQSKPLNANYWLIEVSDISKQTDEEKNIYYRANFDQLTKLPNRSLFDDRCKQLLSAAHRHNEDLALFFIDVDNFKSINDTYGHDGGDTVLIETSKRLCECVRESDTVSRWAGDEFAILLPKIGDKDNINQLLTRIFETFEKPHIIQEIPVQVSISIGISLSPEMGTDFDKLMRFADKAMYRAKNSKNNYYQYYSE